MSILTMPSDIKINSCTMILENNTQIYQSPLNGAIQTTALPGDKWSATLTFANKTKEHGRKLAAFLVSLRGRSGRFYLTPPEHKTPAGSAGGSPVVSAASQTGSTLTITGCTANKTGWLLAGDYFQVGYELKMITQDINTDASGNATLVFQPPLRTSPALNAQIVTSSPKCVMALADDKQAQWAVQPEAYAVSVACFEPLDI